MKIRENSNCDKCNNIDSLEHLFFLCPYLSEFWKYISEEVSKILGKPFSLDISTTLFGIKQEKVTISKQKINRANFLVIIAKLSITKYRYSMSEHSLRYIFENEKSIREKYFPQEPD